MASRIFRNLVVISVLAVLLTAALITSAMYGVYEARISDELRLEAEYIVRALEVTGEDLSYFRELSSRNRITLIGTDGTVLYDSIADAAQMENHAGRSEVLQAQETGWGESTRNSDTLSETTIYCARRTANGNVLRIANTRSSVLGVFLSVLPLIIGILLCVAGISLLFARRAARRIVAPINTLNLDSPLENEAYVELSPLLDRMERQNRQIRSQLREMEYARAELAAIMENMREGMILLDREGFMLSVNGSAARILRLGTGGYIGRKMEKVIHDARLCELAGDALQGRSGDLLIRGDADSCQVFASPVLSGSKVRGAVLLILDVTERFAAEISRREFTANVSHELKTPLTSISGYAQIIRDGIARAEDVPQFAGKICSEAARLVTLVNDILELSRLDEKQSLGRREVLSLRSVLEKLVEDFAPAAARKCIELELQGDDAQVEGYPNVLREMFSNLIDNAIKYTPARGKVDVRIRNDGGCVECAVSDNGIGIPEEHQAHIFERFYRVDKSHSRATGGTGLGLAIVKHAAQIHHIRLQLDSCPGEGTTVTLKFEK